MTNSRRTLVTAPSAKQLAQRIADDTISVLVKKQRAGEQPTIALTGGGMGNAMLGAISQHPQRDSVAWERLTIIWGDERFVSAGSSERNDSQADNALLNLVPVDESTVLRAPASDTGMTLESAAQLYDEAVSAVEQIDLVLLGVGPDGHIASLFPGRAELDEADAAAVAVRNSPKPPPERITLTLPVLSSADRVWLLMSGAAKHEAFEEAFSELVNAGGDNTSKGSDAELLPAARVFGTCETVVYADNSAVTGLEA
jgi:6-phosphogluconolactonase